MRQVPQSKVLFCTSAGCPLKLELSVVSSPPRPKGPHTACMDAEEGIPVLLIFAAVTVTGTAARILAVTDSPHRGRGATQRAASHRATSQRNATKFRAGREAF
jgi:hypothetical protein